MSEPQAVHFTDRQIATRGSGAEHCGQVSATQAISSFLLVCDVCAVRITLHQYEHDSR
jgi:hypothetical protein